MLSLKRVNISKSITRLSDSNCLYAPGKQLTAPTAYRLQPHKHKSYT